jgi:putative nucleotidyltransferase with HDIG domain
MQEQRHRVIFEGLHTKERLGPLIEFLRKEGSLTQQQIQTVVTSPPRILWEVDSLQYAQQLQAALHNMGCAALMEPVNPYPPSSLTISERHARIIKREMSKVLRARVTLAFFLIEVAGIENGKALPSMRGPLETQLTDELRDSDTILAIDDHHFIVLGFGTDKNGIPQLQNKIQRSIKGLLGSDITPKSGHAIFPDEGQTLQKLLYLAEMRSSGEDHPKTRGSSSAGYSGPSPTTAVPDKVENNPLSSYFVKARGKNLMRLINVDTETLWAGFSQIPPQDQTTFLSRLPYNAPCVQSLEERLRTQDPRPSVRGVESYFEAIINQMGLEVDRPGQKALEQSVLAALSRTEDLPTLPAIAAHVFRIASDQESSATELAEVVKNDPALTGKILKIVNAAFYGNPQKIASVMQAVMILGFNEITDIAFGLAAARVFDTTPSEGVIPAARLWEHSLSTAFAAQHLSTRLLDNRDPGVFSAGLLHDIGKIFLMEQFPLVCRQALDTAREHEIPLFEIEMDVMGLSHSEIGRRLASNWNLPEAISEAVGSHHEPHLAKNHPQIAAVVGLADFLCHTMDSSGPETGPVLSYLTYGHEQILRPTMNRLNVSFETLLNETSSILEENRELLKTLL